MTDNYVSGFPEPPYYYEEYDESNPITKNINIENIENIENVGNIENRFKLIEDDKNKDFVKSINNKFRIYDIEENTNIETQEQINNYILNKNDTKRKEYYFFISGRPPPVPLENNYNIYGINYNKTKQIEELEPDDLLYDTNKNLKEEFIRLYKMYKDCFFSLFDDLVNNRKNDKTIIKRLTQIHINLFHILANLRHYQSIDNIINILKVQLKRTQIAIDKIKLSLLKVYSYINFVQTNFASTGFIQIEMDQAEQEEENKKKKKRRSR
ncbi:mediator of RNA polymerase II transcription subunit 7, putative [Hepatocystis sp. ex Piliocolobus tephrosceles]|nr:mediator of RNA polymerase II transcription subunit 7, putative [Hepatocystis sp. ex Piliocolobus tephrosceles]